MGFRIAEIFHNFLDDAEPAMDESLWRNANNIITLTFDDAITLNGTEDFMIRQMLPPDAGECKGTFGPDLSGQFTFTVNGNVLTIEEDGSALTHGAWYELRSPRSWSNVLPFELHYVCMVGDATNDGKVLPNDLTLINSEMPEFNAADDARCDITGDGMILPNDLTLANSNMPNLGVAKPAGH